jgi:hypothetical protein
MMYSMTRHFKGKTVTGKLFKEKDYEITMNKAATAATKFHKVRTHGTTEIPVEQLEHFRQ